MKLNDFCNMMLELKQKHSQHPDCEIIFWESEEHAGFEIWDNYKNYKHRHVCLYNEAWDAREIFKKTHCLEEIEIKSH